MRDWPAFAPSGELGCKDVAELLLANKAEVNGKSNDGLTPLRVAADKRRYNIADFLQRHGGH